MNNRDLELLHNFQYKGLTDDENREFTLRYKGNTEFKNIADGIGFQLAAMKTYAIIKEQNSKKSSKTIDRKAPTKMAVKRIIAAAAVIIVGYVGTTQYLANNNRTLIDNSNMLASISEELPSLHRGVDSNIHITDGYNLYSEAIILEDSVSRSLLLKKAATQFQKGYFLDPDRYKRAAYNAGVALFIVKDYWKSEMMFRYTLEEYQRSTSNIDTYEEAMSYLRLAIIEINKDPNSIQSEESIAHLKKNSSDIESFLPNNYIDPFYKLIIGR